MKGRLIVIEAGDGCGKETQTKLLYDKLVLNNHAVKKVQFPDYQSESSALIKMYLKGEFGVDPNNINPYAVSTFYAADRYASYKRNWEKFYQNGGIILADRYTTSNMIHQGAKIQDPEEREIYLEWLWNLEFVKFELPKPDCVVFLDMHPEFSRILIEQRAKKLGENDKDIHERNYDYMVKTYNHASQIKETYGWITVNCVENGSLKSKEAIHSEIYDSIKKFLI